MGNLRQELIPEYGQGWWQIGWGSGRIVRIDYANRIVIVSFYDKGHRTYEFDHIVGCYERIHGGTWVINDPDAGA